MEPRKGITWMAVMALLLLMWTGCKPDPATPDAQTVSLELIHEVDGSPLQPFKLIYRNEAGNTYQVERLQYYISNITMMNAGKVVFTSDKIHLVDAFENSTLRLDLENVPLGSYDKITLNIGLDPAHNISYSLPNSSENINMAWPDQMGGGYHFMKFEGKFDSQGTLDGYALHIGTNAALTTVTMSVNFEIVAPNQSLILTMNLNEWFRNPHLFDLDTGINYTMGDTLLMQKVAQNGANVFSAALN